MSTPGPVSRTLTVEECQSLLGTASIGRVAVVIAGQPHVVPVNYACSEDVVVFRTAPGTILNEVVLGPMAFETDYVDPATRTGWSVCIHGYGRDLTDAVDERSRRLRAVPIDTWAPGERDLRYEVVPREISGRRLFPATVRTVQST